MVSASDSLAVQWQNPADFLSVVLLIGPDVIQRAIAQMAGRAITPVAFSFGWVTYAVSALLSSFGDGRLMPDTDVTVTVIDTESGHHRESKTWILGRFLRDFNYQLNNEMKDEQSHIPSDFKDEPIPTGNGKGRPWAGLQITVFEVADNPSPAHGIPELDWVWYSGFFVILVQLVIAIIPWIIIGQWPVFLVTGAGNILAITSASLPQWGREKWACPKSGGSTVTITEGNGSRSAIVILRKKDVGLKLEVLARGTRVAPASLFTRIATAVLAMLWILLLITVAGMKEKTWYLLGIGLLGTSQNILASSVYRSPGALGIHINRIDTIHSRFVADTLKQVEEKYPLVGTSLLDVFFPGSLRVNDDEDIAFWRTALDARRKRNKHGIRLDCLPPLNAPQSPTF